jgi:hypothetical protein
MGGRRIAPSLGKSDDLQDTNTGVERNSEDITELNAVTGRFLACAVDPHMALRDQGRSV